jgi:hypothetical protein|eukprot:COSAG02_NODE_3018_length_7541_cov_4.397743_1_plen_428_part_00
MVATMLHTAWLAASCVAVSAGDPQASQGRLSLAERSVGGSNGTDEAVGLRLNVVSNLEQSYADHGSGATMDLFAWAPSCSPTTHAPMCKETWLSLGHTATSSGGTPGTAIVALAGPGDPQALAKPTSLALNWNTLLHGKNKGTSGGVYTAVCPSGYAALGSVAIRHDVSKPDEITPALFPNLRCLKKKYLKAGAQLKLLWDSKPTLYDTPSSVWTQPLEVYQHHPDDATLTLPMLGGHQSFDPPTNSSFQIDLTAGVQVIVPPPPPCGLPPLPACPPCGDQGIGLPPCVCPAPARRPLNSCPNSPPPACKPPHCDASHFIGVDDATQGDWQSNYGKAGYHMFGGLGAYNSSEYLPPFVHSLSILDPGSCRHGRWSTLPTALDPRALSFPSAGVYKSLGFVATNSPASANTTFEIAIDLVDAAQEYIL